LCLNTSLHQLATKLPTSQSQTV